MTKKPRPEDELAKRQLEVLQGRAKPEFHTGQLVELKCGGPTAVVNCMGWDGEYNCHYYQLLWHSQDGQMFRENVGEAAIRRAE